MHKHFRLSLLTVALLILQLYPSGNPSKGGPGPRASGQLKETPFRIFLGLVNPGITSP